MYIKNINQTDENVYLQSKPKFSKDSLMYLRKEKKGYISCYSKNATFLNELIINPVAEKILEYCDGTKTPNQIIDEILKTFNGTKRSIVEKDLKNILFEYTKTKLINWEEGVNPYMINIKKEISDNYTIELASEEDLMSLKYFFENSEERNSILSYLNPARSWDEYRDEITYRQKLFSYSEEFFLIKNSDNKIEGVFSILIPVIKNTSVSTIGVVKMEKKYITKVANFAKEIIRDIAVQDISKIKLLAIKDEEHNENLSELLIKSNFKDECVLEKEFGEKDIKIVSYIY